ncbi:MFS transporter [Corynebacterium sp. 335C]
MTTPRIRLLALAGILLTALNMRVAVTALPPLIDRITPDLGLTNGLIGVIGMLPPVLFAVSAFAAPALLRRLGLPGGLAAAMLATAGGLVLRVVGPSTPALLAGTAVALFALGVTNALAPLAVRAYFPDRVPSMSVGYMIAMQVGMTAAPLLAEPLASATGSWRTSLLVWAPVAVVAALPWLPLLLGRVHALSGDGPVLEEPGAGARVPVWRSPVGLGLLMMFGFTSFTTFGFMMFIPVIFTGAGASAEFGGLMLAYWSGLGGVISVLGPMAAGRMRDPYPVLVACFLMYVAGNAGMMLAPMAAPWVWVTLSGLGPMSFPMALTLVNLRARTTAGARGLSSFCQGGGYTLACVGPLLFGLLHDVSGGWLAPFAMTVAATGIVATGSFLATRDRFVEDTLRPRGGAASAAA